MWRWLAGLLMIASATAAPGTLLPPEMLASAQIGPMVVSVWLPPGYETSHERYPVLYMQDGQNVFDGAHRAWNGRTWGADTIAGELIGQHKIIPVIIVAIDNKGSDRGRQYFPQAAFARLDPALQDDLGTAAPFSDAYVRFLVKELKPMIDARFRTKPDAPSTFVMGSSMGGLISLYAFAEHPDVFGGAGCLSTHWLMAVPGPAAPHEVLFAAYESYLRNKGLKPGRLWFDHGTVGLDSNYAPYQERIDTVLQRAGWRPGVDFVSKTYPGADHNEDAWRARLGESLAFLLGTN